SPTRADSGRSRNSPGRPPPRSSSTRGSAGCWAGRNVVGAVSRPLEEFLDFRVAAKDQDDDAQDRADEVEVYDLDNHQDGNRLGNRLLAGILAQELRPLNDCENTNDEGVIEPRPKAAKSRASPADAQEVQNSI